MAQACRRGELVIVLFLISTIEHAAVVITVIQLRDDGAAPGAGVADLKGDRDRDALDRAIRIQRRCAQAFAGRRSIALLFPDYASRMSLDDG